MASAKQKTQKALGGLGARMGEHWREIALVLFAAGSLFALVSLIGYSESDPTLLHPNTGRVANPCGPLGALLADVLFQTLGSGAWATFAAMVLSILALVGRPVFQLGRALVGLAAFVCTLGLLHLCLGGEGAYPAGGLVGQATAEGFEAVVGVVGTALILGSVLVAALTIVFHIRWSLVARRGVDGVAARWPAVRGALQRNVQSVGATAKVGAAAGASAVGGSLVGSAGAFGQFSRRVLLSFRGSGTDLENDPFASDLEESDPDDAFLSNPGTLATAASVPLIAEVEWDPTGVDSGVLFNGFSTRDVGDRSSSASAVVGTGIGSSARPEPLDVLEHTQPGQISHSGAPVDHTVPGTHVPLGTDPGRVPGRPAAHTPTGNGVTLTPEPPTPRAVPHVGGPRTVGVELAEGMAERVEDDGGEVKRKRQGWSDFRLPRLSLLDIVPEQKAHFDSEDLRRLATQVEETLASFKITGEVVNVRVGPVVTIFEYSPDAGIKVSKIAGLSDDLAMALCAVSVRIVAPIPGKGVVGIEIPSPKRLNIYFRELLSSEAFRTSDFELPVALGKDVEGKPVIANLVKMPHLLVAGTTGAGKSVGVNGMLMTLLFTCPPDDLRLLLIDPKQLEFKMYDDVPHLLHPVVTDPKKAQAALDWAVREMEDRYSRLAAWNTRNIVSFNTKVETEAKNWTPAKARKYAPKGWSDGDPLPGPEKMPFIVIVIDELADLMMVAKKEIEQSIARLAQKARACGIHLILATQRPSADVVTGLIKSNMPTRIGFKLKSALDSRVILDENGAEKLLGRGDMLHSPNGGELQRVHGAFVSDEEVERVCDYLRSQGAPQYIEAITAEVEPDGGGVVEDLDPLFQDAVDIVVGAGKASTSMIQRHLKIGYNRAARIVDQMEASGVIGPADGARPREVLV